MPSTTTQLDKITLKPLEGPDKEKELKCQFNPTEFTLTRDIDYGSKTQSGTDDPQVSYSGAKPSSLSMSLFFDAFEAKGDVRKYLDDLWSFTQVMGGSTKAADDKSRPPKLLMTWGVLKFTVVITKLSVKFTLFHPDGTPARATADTEFQVYGDKIGVEQSVTTGQNPTSRGRAGLRGREIMPHDTLAQIAYQEFGDASKWRLLADLNGIDDPLRLPVGEWLEIPKV